MMFSFSMGAYRHFRPYEADQVAPITTGPPSCGGRLGDFVSQLHYSYIRMQHIADTDSAA
jgi:hypothetical protein